MIKKIRLRACPSCGVPNLYDAAGGEFTPLYGECRSCGKELEETPPGEEDLVEEETSEDEEPTPS